MDNRPTHDRRRTLSRTAFIAAVVGVLTLGSAREADAALFVTTGQTGAQVQLDRDHTQSWTYYVNRPVNDVTGTRFTMKRGPQTSDNITLSLYRGTLAEVPTLTPLTSITLTPSSFTQQYTPINFTFPSPVDLEPFYYYTAVLTSTAPDRQSAAYFIKGGSLSFTDDLGAPVTPPGGATLTSAAPGQVPEPAGAAIVLAGPAALLLSRRRRHA